MNEEIRYTGKITKVDTDKGYGFISTKQIPFTRIFFHWSHVLQNATKFLDLKKGMTVSFTASELPDVGWRAFKIKVESIETPKNDIPTKV